MRWLASRFLDVDHQEELGILTPAVRARKASQEADPANRMDTAAGPAPGTDGGSLPPTAALTEKPPVRPAGVASPTSGSASSATSARHHAAHGLVLHVSDLRRQHRCGSAGAAVTSRSSTPGTVVRRCPA